MDTSPEGGALGIAQEESTAVPSWTVSHLRVVLQMRLVLVRKKATTANQCVTEQTSYYSSFGDRSAPRSWVVYDFCMIAAAW